MPQTTFSLGVDYGTNSVRALIVDTRDGREVGSAVWNYRHGEDGIVLDAKDPHLARQHPQDYFDGFSAAVKAALEIASADREFQKDKIVGIGVDTTGSTPVPVDARGTPLACIADFGDDPNAMAWLWKDHTAWAEAGEITELAERRDEPYLKKCGGTYSSEWFWSKILHCARVAPAVFEKAFSWVECQDLVPAWLTGETDPLKLKRGVCAAGHKAMFHADWGGLPSEAFLRELDPRLPGLRSRLYQRTHTADQEAGKLTAERAADSNLPAGVPVAVGAFDAHLGAVGSGVCLGTMVKIMGTSTCDILVGDESLPDIPGVCGMVPGSVIPGQIGIEAGQSAVGDLFNWCAKQLHGGENAHAELNRDAAKLRPGESGLLALDWNNGNRTILVDPLLTGLLIGQTLHSTPAEIYRALIEATAFGARKILERIESYGVAVERIVVCGGVAVKSELTLQIYADVCNRPIQVSRTEHTCALGAAICGSVVGGVHADIPAAIAAMTGIKPTVYLPSASAGLYDRLFKLYSRLHDAFGIRGTESDLSGVMKELLSISKEARA
ncbi:MAG: Ribulokinase [Fimbriimonadaceae bacterium]|nr:Ribulokinase [Fimbriimonadaceae bacterium]